MKVLVINSGSSSIKFQVIDMPNGKTQCKGLIERLGEKNSEIHYQNKKGEFHIKCRLKNHLNGLEQLMPMLIHDQIGVINSYEEIDIVGHRVVHGGSSFQSATLIDDSVLGVVKNLSSLAPLHNPANAIGIESAMALFPKAKQVAVFDTAFHQTLAPSAYTYAIPKAVSEEHHIRVYGFHGTSHKYVSQKAMAHLSTTISKIITIHLGNGCSISAIKDGKSVEHSLGFAPSNGLIMGTRSGDVDQSVIFFLMDSCGMTSNEVNEMLQKKSGLLGLTGYSDVRDIQEGAKQGNKDCLLALNMIAHRIKKYIGAYIAILNGLDALVFTGGIGENSAIVRRMICMDMETFGIHVDEAKNTAVKNLKHPIQIQKEESGVHIMVIPTNEELEIAQQSYNLLGPQREAFN